MNASKFTLSLAGDGKADVLSVSNPLDQALLLRLAGLVEASTNAFEDFDYARALERTEQFFWRFTDDYVELVKLARMAAKVLKRQAPLMLRYQSR